MEAVGIKIILNSIRYISIDIIIFGFVLFQNELAQGLFFFLGAANIEKGIKECMHNPDFDIDEDCLEFGVKTITMFLFEQMNNNKYKNG